MCSQCLVDDDEMRGLTVVAIGAALVDGGRFAFETRHPAARGWAGSPGTHPTPPPSRDPAGRVLRLAHCVESVVDDIVTFTKTTSDAAGYPLRADRARLRFLSVPAPGRLPRLVRFRGRGAGTAPWDPSPVTDYSPEIVTIAGRR